MQVQGQLAAQYIQDVMQVSNARAVPLAQIRAGLRPHQLRSPMLAENHRQVLHEMRHPSRSAARRLGEEVYGNVYGPLPRRDGLSLAGVGGAREAASGAGEYGRRLRVMRVRKIETRAATRF